MKLEPLFRMSGANTERAYTDALPGGERHGFVTGSGVVSGARMRGTFRRANVPHHRADDVNVESTDGVITTSDGGLVFYTMRGIAVRVEPSAEDRHIFASIVFRTSDPRYLWLNTVFAVAEAPYDGKGTPPEYDVYECRADPKS